MQIKNHEDIGKLVRETRKAQGLTQIRLARLCRVGPRFIGDLENGKPTCQIDKIFVVLLGLGIKVDMIPPFDASGDG